MPPAPLLPMHFQQASGAVANISFHFSFASTLLAEQQSASMMGLARVGPRGPYIAPPSQGLDPGRPERGGASSDYPARGVLQVCQPTYVYIYAIVHA